MDCLISFLKFKHKYRFRGHNMCSIVYSSYLSINSEVKDSRKKNTKTEIKHILHFPLVSKLHQLASPLLAEAGGDVCPMSGQAKVRHIEPSHLSGLLGLSPSLCTLGICRYRYLTQTQPSDGVPKATAESRFKYDTTKLKPYHSLVNLKAALAVML